MKGRIEHQLAIEKYNDKILADQADYIKSYYYHLLSSSKQGTTTRTYINYVVKFINTLEKNKGKKITSPKEITINDVTEYMAQLRYVKSNKEIRQTSHAYRAIVWSALNNFFEYCINNEIINKNPLKNIIRDSGERDDVKRIALTSEEIKTVQQAIENGVGSTEAKKKQIKWKERDLCIFLLFLSTGMRVTALTEINCEDIDYDNKIISIIDKNEKTQQYPISDFMVEILKTWESKRLKILGNSYFNDSFFISSHKKRITDRTVRNIIYKYTSVLEHKIGPHKLRSTYGTNLYKATGDLYFVQECMGHANIRTTTKYIKKNGDERMKAVKIMEDIIKI